MRWLFNIFLVFGIAFAISACSKHGNIRWVYYDETNCTDKWEFTNNNEILKERVVDYMNSRGVKILEIEIFRIDADDQTCFSCHCPSGRQFKCKIRKRDLEAARSEGFYD